MTNTELQNHGVMNFNHGTTAFDDESWREALSSAVMKTDEAAIWAVMSQHQNNDDAHEALTNMVSRMAYHDSGRNFFCELFMMPVITEFGCNAINEKSVWTAVRGTTNEALKNWFDKDVALTIFDCVMPMDWITTWKPKIIRDHLNRLRPGNEKITAEFVTETILLPDEAPRLGFVAMACSSRRRWPAAPELDSVMDKRLRDVVSRALQISAPSQGQSFPVAPTVLNPERLQYAITDGLVRWLLMLHKVIEIRGWALIPSMKTPDVVKITLSLDSEQVPLTQFNIRLHQIGMQGLSEVIAILGECAPNMEVPSDMRVDSSRN